MNKKILIVEDDKDFLCILQVKFKAEGFSIVTAGNGEEGVMVAEAEKPDLILTDLLMPRMDGLEMAKKIRQSNNVGIIFLTNTQDPDYTKKIEESGNFKYLVKSNVRLDDIINNVKNYFGIDDLIVPSRL